MSIKRHRKIVAAVMLVGALLIGFGTGIVYSRTAVFHTPQTSNYVPVVPTPGWRTPPMSDYVPVAPTIGWRTPQTSNYAP